MTLRPVRPASDFPEVDDITDEIEHLALDVFQEVEKCRCLRIAHSEVDVGNEYSAVVQFPSRGRGAQVRPPIAKLFMLSEGPDSCYTRMTVACGASRQPRQRSGIREACDTPPSGLDALEYVFPDEEQRRIDNSDHQEGERDRVGRRFRKPEIRSPGCDGKRGGETEKGENGENDLNESQRTCTFATKIFHPGIPPRRITIETPG